MSTIASEHRALQERAANARRADSCARTRAQQHGDQAADRTRLVFEMALQKASGSGPFSAQRQHRIKVQPSDPAKDADAPVFEPACAPWALTDPIAHACGSPSELGISAAKAPVAHLVSLPPASATGTALAPPCESLTGTSDADHLHVDLRNGSLPLRGFSMRRGPGTPTHIELYAQGLSSNASLVRSAQRLRQRLSGHGTELTVQPAGNDTGHDLPCE